MIDVIAVRDRIASRLVVASISGGKDSAAMSLYLRELEVEHRRVFLDTGWEHPATYEYLRGELTRVLGPIEEVRGERTFVELVRHKGMFPSRTRRFCTQELKVRPMARYLAALGREAVNTVGVRAQESIARARLTEWADGGEGFDCEIWRPIIDWSLDQVVEIHRRHGLRPNPLYLMGASRVGCWPCIHARKAEIRHLADTDPARIDLIEQLEREVGAAAELRHVARGETIESAGHARPRFFQAPMDRDHSAAMWPIRDVVEWSRTSRGGRQFELFASRPSDDGCMRLGFCETPEGQ